VPDTGKGEEGRIMWNDKTHEALVKKAADLLLAAEVESLPSVRLFTRLFWPTAPFQTEVLERGLKDAGGKPPWWNPHIGENAMFASHFCDPRTSSSLPLFSRLGWSATAVSEGQRYFDLAVEAARRILRLGASSPPGLFQQAGDYLGLALHFFTDLTQPMHAANFADIVGDDEPVLLDDRRHTAFEDYAGTRIDAIPFDPLVPDLVTDAALALVANAEALFLDTARQAKNVWDNGLGALARRKPRTRDAWGAECDDYVRATFEPAPARVARLFAYFAFCVRQDLAQAGLERFRWHELADPVNQYVLASEPSTEYVRSVQTPARYRSLVALLFDEQGRCSLLPCNQREVSWGLVSGPTTDSVKSQQPNQAEASRFRIATRVDGTAVLYSGARIRRPDGTNGDGDYAITVDRSSGYAYADYPPYGIADPGAQPLRLRPNAHFTDYEWQEIAGARPGVKMDLPWWGTPGGSPAWRGTWRLPISSPGTAAALAMVSPGSAQLHLFAIFAGALHQRDWNGLWYEWHRVPYPEGMVFTAPLTAVIEEGRMHVFARGSAVGQLHHGTYSGGAWSWMSIAVPADLAFLSSCSTGPGRLDLMATTAGRLLWWCPFDGSSWGSWKIVSFSGVAYYGPISACSMLPGRIDVTDVTEGGIVRQTFFQGGEWRLNLFPPTTLLPAHALVTSWDLGRLTVTAVGENGRVALSHWAGTGWTEWQYGERSDGTVHGPACAASWGPYRLDVIVVNQAGHLCPREYC
jgi:hypothetical protein